MTDISPFDGGPDPRLGAALRDALSLPHDGAFVTRIRAQIRLRERSWEEVLSGSGWLWQGLVAATLALAAAGYTILTRAATPEAAEASVAVQLLDGELPGSQVILASLTRDR